ncbi:L-alanine-DL-glutamate epimerase (EC 5.1.1.n1) [hydrothermal vent metagenome]|uniref:L-alanine-DL-glutamate epimerase n=1 Tax=hydrothermal vent metagenome TaxID=652676 RepID=A0A3B0UHC3_9ZZZZ
MKNLVIEKIEVIKLNITLKEPIVISLGTSYKTENIVIKIHTGPGLTGIGECSPEKRIVGELQSSGFETAKYLSSIIKGKDPLAIEDRMYDLARAIEGNNTLKSAFDMALYDLLAKSADMPLYQLLGGGNTREIHTDMTIYLGPPEKMAAQALKYKNDGFPAIKVKLGETAGQDVARIQAIRDAIGYDTPIRIDANQGWDTVTAIKTLKALEEFDIEHCEEPIAHWNNRGLARVRRESPIPIMADESVFDHIDAFRLASMGACDYFNIKLSKTGGIHNALKIIAIGEASGIKSQVGCMSESRYALTALTHLAASRNNIAYFDIDSSLSHAEDPVTGGIQYKGKGKWELPDSPGIGADFDSEFIDKMEKVVI